MKTTITRIAVLFAAAIALLGASLEPGPWVPLFSGRGTAALRGYKQKDFPAKGWVVEGDTLRCVKGGGGGDLVSREQYSDFELRFEWKVSPGANSGVMYRVSEEYGASYESGPEYQVLDDAKHGDGKNPKTSAGALYALIACNQSKVLKPVGEWNRSRVVVVGNHVEHWLNGAKVVEYDLNTPAFAALVADSKFKAWPGYGKQASGHICIQDHGDDVWYRSIRVRTLKAK